MKQSNNTPKLRFPEFSEDWERRKLNHFLTTSKKKNTDERFDKHDVLSVSGDVGIVNQIEFQGRSFAGASVVNYGVVEYGDIVYTKSPLKANPYGIIKANKGKAGIVSTLYAVYKPKDFTSSDFVQYYFEYDNRLNHYLKPLVNKGAKNDMKVTDENALNGYVIFPTLDEQTTIGNFFRQIDKFIALHQGQLDKVKTLKKGLLQKMFPQQGETVPQLRFPQFTDAWECQKLGEVVERVTRKNKDLLSTLPLTISAQYGLVDQNTFFNKTVASKDVSGYYLIKNGEFAYNKSYSNGYPWGAIKRLDLYEMGVLSTLYILFKPIKINSDFLTVYYDSNVWHREVAKYAAEGARNHGLLNISTDDFFKSELTIPPTEQEQTTIGNFFRQFDDLISLYQRKLEHLKTLKKALLQQMFV